MAILNDLHSENRGANALSTKQAYQNSVPAPCQGLLVFILAYGHGATELDCVSLTIFRQLAQTVCHTLYSTIACITLSLA